MRRGERGFVEIVNLLHSVRCCSVWVTTPTTQCYWWRPLDTRHQHTCSIMHTTTQHNTTQHSSKLHPLPLGAQWGGSSGSTGLIPECAQHHRRQQCSRIVPEWVSPPTHTQGLLLQGSSRSPLRTWLSRFERLEQSVPGIRHTRLSYPQQGKGRCPSPAPSPACNPRQSTQIRRCRTAPVPQEEMHTVTMSGK
jgi:hypothetical protein